LKMPTQARSASSSVTFRFKRHVGLAQPIEPCSPCSGVGWRVGNDGYEFGDRAIDRAADCAGRAVDVRRREALEQRDGAGGPTVISSSAEIRRWHR
jgi:hypothetical protein